MKKRKYIAFNKYGSKFIISYIDKKYKLYDEDDSTFDLIFCPEGVKIELSEDSSYFTKFGKLYRRYIRNVRTNSKYYYKKYIRAVYFPIKSKYYMEFFDDLNAAKLYLELQEKEAEPCSDVCCEAAR